MKENMKENIQRIWGESLKSLKSLMQIFAESANSANSAKQIFATFATFATFAMQIFHKGSYSAVRVSSVQQPTNFQRISNLSPTISTVKVAQKSRINPFLPLFATDSILSRLCLVSLIWMLLMVGGFTSSVWGSYTATLNQSSDKTFGSTTGATFSITNLNDWEGANTNSVIGKKHCAGYHVSASTNAVISWSGVASGKCINISSISINATVQSGWSAAYKNRKMYIYTSVSTINTKENINCCGESDPINKTITGNTYLEDIGNAGSITMYGDGHPMYISSITITYTIDDLPTFTFTGTGSANPAVGGNKVQISFDNSSYTDDTKTKTLTGAKLSTTSVTQDIYFKAVPADGYFFEGWFTNSGCTGDAMSTSNPYLFDDESNSTAGSTVTKTLYAKFDNRLSKEISWNQTINDTVRSAVLTMTASVPEGESITYTASPAGLVSISGSTVTCLKAGDVTITASSGESTSYFAAEDVEKSFTIYPHAITTNPTASGTLTYEQTLKTISPTGGAVTDNIAGSWAWKYPTSVPVVGTANQVAVFTPSSSVIDTVPLECNVSVTVNKATPDVTCSIGMEYDVDEEIDLSTEWTRDGDGARSYSIVSFTPLNDKNNGAAGDPIIEGNRLYLRKAGTLVIQMDIAEGTNYNARTGLTKTITINKRENTISINGTANSYSTEMYMESTLAGGITLSATNTDYSGSAFVVTAGAGAAVGSSVGEINALYTSLSATTGKIESNHNTGDATWTIYQPENYKYEEASATLNVNVKLVDEATNCYVLNDPTEHDFTTGMEFGHFDKEDEYEINGPVDKLYFKAKANGVNYFVAQYSTDNGENWYDVCMPDLTGDYPAEDYGPYQIPEMNITHIRFGAKSGATLKKWFKDVKVTRKTWLNVDNDTITIDRTSTSNPIYPSDGTGVGTLTIDYSLASGGDLHIYNDNPEKFTLSQTTISSVDCKTATATINLSYESAEAGTDYAHLVIYNDVYRKEVTLTGITVLREQTMSWNVGDAIHLGDEVENAADATVLPVSYISSDSTVIDIVDGKLVAKKVGDAEITAHSDGNVEYAEKEITKTITVTSDLVQEIVWNQPVLRRLRIGGSNVTLEASATSSVGGCSTNGARPITYTSANTSVVEIVNTNQIRIVGAGRTYVTASQAGGLDADGHRYMAVSLEKEVIVNDPNAPCTMTYLYQQREGVDYTGNDGGPYYRFGDNGNRTMSLDDEPGYMLLDYKTESSGNGTMYIDQLLSTGWSVAKTIGTPPAGSWTHDSILLDRSATSVRVRVAGKSKGYHYFRNAKISLARYIETSELSTFEAKVGQSVSQDLTISYNNLARNASLTLGSNNSKFAISEDVIEGTCGDKDNVVIRVTYTPTEATDGEEETLTISDGTTTTRVTLRGEASLTERYISWGQESPVDVYSAESITLNAQALVVSTNAPAGSVYYSLGGLSTTGTITGTTLTFDQAGVAYVAAQGVADARYNTPVAVTKQFNVQITPTEVITAPTIANAEAGTALGSLVIDASSAVVNNTITDAVVAGTFSVQSGDISSVGTHTVTLLFTPTESEKYTTCTCEVDVEILPKAITFNNGSGDSKWETVGNWSVAGVDENSAVTIAGNLVIDEEVAVYSLVISEEGTVTIDPEGGLTVGAGGITGATAEKLILKAGTEGVTRGQTGYLRISPEYTGAMPQATVELFATSYYDQSIAGSDNVATWQGVGAPISDAGVLASTVYPSTWVYSWDEEEDKWVNNRATLELTPFTGFSITQKKYSAGRMYSYDGHLVSGNEVVTKDLNYTEGHGDNMLANSFAAPMDISQFNDDDFIKAEKTIYIRNAGTRAQSLSPEDGANAPGNYLAIPIGSAIELASTQSFPLLIPSMQGFWVKATGSEAKVKFDYSRLVWGVNYSGDRTTKPLRAPKQQENAENRLTGALKMSIVSGTKADHLYFLEAEKYDAAFENGYDAHKIMDAGMNIFSVEGDDHLAVDATNSLIGTRVGVRTGEETAYTLVFSHVNSEEEMMLWDTEADERVEIREGGMYTFFAEPNSEITNRFVIVEAEAQEIATGVEDVQGDAKVHKFIKDDKLFILKNGVLYDATGRRVRQE